MSRPQKAPDRPAPTALEPAWVIGDYDTTELACEDHAKEYAATCGLVWEYPGSTLESVDGYAYAVAYSGDLEADYPHVCGVCGIHLDTALTGDGVEYVRENYAPAAWHLWGIDA